MSLRIHFPRYLGSSHPKTGEQLPKGTDYYCLPGGGVGTAQQIHDWAREYGADYTLLTLEQSIRYE